MIVIPGSVADFRSTKKQCCIQGRVPCPLRGRGSVCRTVPAWSNIMADLICVVLFVGNVACRRCVMLWEICSRIVIAVNRNMSWCGACWESTMMWESKVNPPDMLSYGHAAKTSMKLLHTVGGRSQTKKIHALLLTMKQSLFLCHRCTQCRWMNPVLCPNLHSLRRLH